MGIISSAFGAGLGQGIANMGAYMSAADQKEEDRQARLELAREALAEKKAASLAAIEARTASGGGRGGGLAALKAAGGSASDVGLELGAGSQAPFTSAVPTRTDDDPENSDRTSRMGLINDASAEPSSNTVFDGAAYGASEQRRKDKNINILTKVEDPDKYRSLQEGIQQEVITDLSKRLAGENDPKKRELYKSEIADLKAALDKGDRFKIEGGTRINQATGDMATTEVGKAAANKDNAAAGESSADAKKAAAEVDKIEAEIKAGNFGKSSQDRLTTIVNSSNATIKSLNEGSKGRTEEERADWKRQMDAAVNLRDKANTMLNSSLDAKAEKPTPTITPVKDNGGSGKGAPRVLNYNPKTKRFE